MEMSEQVIDDQTRILSLNGALNARSAEETKEKFKKMAAEGVRYVVLDLTDVPFIDSSGLAALVSGLKAMSENQGSLRLASPQSQARLLFELTMFDRVFEIFDSVDAAQASLGEGSD